VGWTGDLRLGGKVDIHAGERFDAAVVFERRDGDLQTVDERGTQALGLSNLHFELSAHDGQWVFSQALAGRTLGEMTGAISVKTTPQSRWPAADSPLEGVLEAHVANLGIWSAWVPAGWRLAGELKTSATIGGRFGAPEYTGSLQGSELGVRNVLQGVNVSGGQLAVRLDGASAQIERFTLKGGDGTLALTGGATFGSAPKVQLHAQAEHFRVLGRIDRQLTASGHSDFSWQGEQFKLDGTLGVDEGLFDARRGNAPGLDDDVTVHRASDPEPAAEAATSQRSRRDVAVNIELNLGQKLRVRAFGVDTALRGKLRISTPNGRMAINGEVSTEGGTYTGYGQKLDIERGIVAFSGAYATPRLDILALRPNLDTRVGVQITGNLPNIRVRLYSDPDLSDTDKLSWLVLGRAPDGLGRTDTALLQRAAVALLSGEGEAPTDAFMKSIGIDELSLRQSDTEVRETVINIGKQLSRRWYVGYERGVNATTGTFQLIYRIAQRFTLRAQSGQENSLDVIWTWKFDDLPRLPAPARAVPP
jgi:translocation and assembly module TamB